MNFCEYGNILGVLLPCICICISRQLQQQQLHGSRSLPFISRSLPWCQSSSFLSLQARLYQSWRCSTCGGPRSCKSFSKWQVQLLLSNSSSFGWQNSCLDCSLLQSGRGFLCMLLFHTRTDFFSIFARVLEPEHSNTEPLKRLLYTIMWCAQTHKNARKPPYTPHLHSPTQTHTYC